MIQWMRAGFWCFARWVLRLRYRVEVVGLEKLEAVAGPTLVMPNHPGYIDPPLVLTHVRLKRSVRPVVTAKMYRTPLFYPFMRLVDALEVPELAEQSRGARRQTLAMIDAVVAGLQRGDSFVIYPSGRAQRNGTEVIGASRAVSEILDRFPNANLVLVRTRGIWGSMFSYARTGTSPAMVWCLFRGLGWLLANLLFLTPKRRVTMTVELLDRKSLPGLTRDVLNRHLEQWYNAEGPEQPAFVPYHPLFGPRTFEFPTPESGEVSDLDKIRPATIKAVNEILEEHLGRPLSEDEKQADTSLDQIGLDSLDRMDVAMKLEDRFGFRSDRVADTLGELWALAEGLTAGAEGAAQPAPAAWMHATVVDGPVEVLAETVAEAFVRRALLHPGDVAAADAVSGVLTYRKMLVAARLMAARFARLPGSAVGVMLPASVAADITFLGLHLAGKLPVMLNWTTGPANLATAVQKLAIQRVVTSRKLIDRLAIDVPGADCIFLEDVRTQISKFSALRTLLGSYLFPKSCLRGLPRPGVDDPAVVLFTSGSESAPKAVPLSHENLISNVRDAMAILQATRRDSLLGSLPPFHSFGLLGNINGPLLAGVRVVHYPDPTNASGLVRTIARYQVTIVVTAPTFLSYMLKLATADDFRTIRVVVTGAEKCPEALFQRTAQLAPHALVLEGYGITECSPVVSGNGSGRIKAGSVGRPVSSVEICVVDPQSQRRLPPDTPGMLLVRGASIFQGYLAYDGPDPFVEVDGKRWYVTGDIVRVDPQGFIFFQGRLKRFLKAGGEMISLPALETPLVQLHPPTENGPQVAVEGIETPEGRLIVLFTTLDISLRDANAVLTQAGFRGVMRLDEVVRLSAIPVLGTGKTDYKVLRRMVAERIASAKGK